MEKLVVVGMWVAKDKPTVLHCQEKEEEQIHLSIQKYLALLVFNVFNAISLIQNGLNNINFCL